LHASGGGGAAIFGVSRRASATRRAADNGTTCPLPDAPCDAPLPPLFAAMLCVAALGFAHGAADAAAAATEAGTSQHWPNRLGR
jgi:hypothetical protein